MITFRKVQAYAVAFGLFFLSLSLKVQAYEYFEYASESSDTLGRAVFSESEKHFLRMKGLGRVANAVRVTSVRPLPIKFGVRDRVGVIRTYAVKSNAEEYQWALANNGKGVLNIPLVGSATYPVKKVFGEDAGIYRAYAVLRRHPFTITRKARIAVLDSGLDTAHPEFQGLLFRNEKECEWHQVYNTCRDAAGAEEVCLAKAGPVDPDENGYSGDCHGMNFAVGTPTPTDPRVGGRVVDDDPSSHGTFVSGIIAATDNGAGSTGVMDAGSIELMPIKVSGRLGAGIDLGKERAGEEDPQFDGKYSEVDHIARGLLYAVRMKANLIHMSLGWGLGEDSLLMREMVKLALSEGLGVVVASGNTASFTGSYPCAYDGVLCVGAHRADGSVAPFSSFGATVDLLAPGEWILSTTIKDKLSVNYTEARGYTFRSGTSFSAPYVTGALGLLYSRGISIEEGRARLCAGARRDEGEVAIALSSRQVRSSRCGKLDLERSLNIPNPLLAPLIEWAEKPPYYLRFVDGSVVSEWRINFVNRGAAAIQALTVKVGGSSFTFDTWGKGERKTITVSVPVPNIQSNSLEKVAVQVLRGSRLLQTLEFYRDWIRTLSDEDIRTLADVSVPVTAAFSEEVANGRKVRIESVPAHGLAPSWAILQSVQGKIKFKRLSQEGGETTWTPVPVRGGGLQAMSETEKIVSVVLLTMGKVDGLDRGTLHWVCYEKARAGRPDILRKHLQTVLMDFTDLAELFSPVYWVRSVTSPCGSYPVWVQEGRISEGDRTRPGPWEKEPVNRTRARIFSFDPDSERIRTAVIGDHEDLLGIFYAADAPDALEAYTRGRALGSMAVRRYRLNIGPGAKFSGALTRTFTAGPLLDLAPNSSIPIKEETIRGVQGFYRRSPISGDLEWTLRLPSDDSWLRQTFSRPRMETRGYAEWGTVFSFNGAREYPAAILFSNDNLHIWHEGSLGSSSIASVNEGIALYEIARFPFPYKWIWSEPTRGEIALFLPSFDGLFLGSRVWRKDLLTGNTLSPIRARMLATADCSEWDLERLDDIRRSYIWFQCPDGLYRIPLLLN